MPYLLLAIGLVTGLYALYRFFLTANLHQIKALFMAAALLALCLAVFYLAVTGRLPVAAALLPAFWPFLRVFLRKSRARGAADPSQPGSPAPGRMTRAEALEILGLEDGAEETDILEAYRRLMRKVHPDHEGSDWMAAKLNQARDILLG
jgi:hypothetical protein